ncbi:MAG: hypothetical protein M1814_005607 [Vezdaea aestivalis]|nr:MAG: hypothetical protein M1814_005607 [Vezdaea aestivalis]
MARKKNNYKHYTKPSAAPTYSARPSQSSSSTVNDLITRSRQTALSSVEAREAGQRFAALAATKSLHPSLKEFFDIPDIPTPRPRINDTRARLQQMCSPVARESMTISLKERSIRDPYFLGPYEVERTEVPFEGFLPVQPQIPRRSLLHLTLRALAKNWRQHVEGEGSYLADLPERLKSIVLGYIAREHPSNGLLFGDLLCLYPTQEREENVLAVSGRDTLELSGSIGHSITGQQLASFLMVGSKASTKDQDSEVQVPRDQEPEERNVPMMNDKTDSVADIGLWEEQLIQLEHRPFDGLTRLSLANPGPNFGWDELLGLREILCQCTHLSLAYWSMPAYRPGLRREQEQMLPSRAMITIQSLAEATPLLQWLDLTGCSEWFGLLFGSEGQFKWNQLWRHLKKLVLGMGYDPLVDVREKIKNFGTYEEMPYVVRDSACQALIRGMISFSVHGDGVSACEDQMKMLSSQSRTSLDGAQCLSLPIDLQWEYASIAELEAKVTEMATKMLGVGLNSPSRMAWVYKTALPNGPLQRYYLSELPFDRGYCAAARLTTFILWQLDHPTSFHDERFPLLMARRGPDFDATVEKALPDLSLLATNKIAKQVTLECAMAVYSPTLYFGLEEY